MFAVTHSKSAIAFGVGLILLVGIGIRVAYWPAMAASPNFVSPPQDGLYHQHWARGLAFGDWQTPPDTSDPHIPTNPFFRPPGYPYFLAFIYRLFGPWPAAPRLFQMALGLVSALLLFGLTRQAFGSGAALIGMGLFVVYWGFIYFEGFLLDPPLLIFLTLALLWVCASWTRSVTVPSALAAGLLAGLGTLVRPNMLLCAPVCLLWGVWQAWRRKDRGGLARLVCVYSGMLLVTLSPAFWRNYRVSGEWPVLTTNGGINLYIGNNARTDCAWPQLPRNLEEISGLRGWTSFDYPLLVNALSKSTGQAFSPVSADRYFRRLGQEYIRAHPWQTAERILKKLLLFWGPYEISNNTVVEFERQRSRILKMGLNFPSVLTAALLGLAFIRRQKSGEGSLAGLLVLFIAAYCASFLLFFVSASYRLIVAPLLMAFAGKGLYELGKLIRKREYVLAGSIALLLLGGYSLLTRSVVAYTPNLAFWYAEQGQALYRAGHIAESVEAIREAIRLDPGFAISHANLGACLSQMGDLEGARLSYQEAVKLDPRLAFAHANLGMMCLKLGRLDEAETHLRAAVELRPDFLNWWNRLGAVMATRGNAASAEECFRKALELNPNLQEAKDNLDRLGRANTLALP